MENTPPSVPTPAPQVSSVATGRGLSWLSAGWELFMKSPLIWVVNIIVVAVILMVLGAIPLIGVAANILSPVFGAGLVMACRDQELGRDLTVPQVFAGFSYRTSSLIGAGLLGLGLSLGVVILLAVVGMVLGVSAEMSDTAEQAGPVLLLLMLVGLALFVPIAMAMWFAPALLAFNENMGVVESFKTSFAGCMANIMPFLVYGLLLMVAGFVATIPLGLGWLVLAPVMVAANYQAYKEIFAGGETPA